MPIDLIKSSLTLMIDILAFCKTNLWSRKWFFRRSILLKKLGNSLNYEVEWPLCYSVEHTLGISAYFMQPFWWNFAWADRQSLCKKTDFACHDNNNKAHANFTRRASRNAKHVNQPFTRMSPLKNWYGHQWKW